MSRFDYDYRPKVQRDFNVSSDAMRWAPDPPEPQSDSKTYIWHDAPDSNWVIDEDDDYADNDDEW